MGLSECLDDISLRASPPRRFIVSVSRLPSVETEESFIPSQNVREIIALFRRTQKKLLAEPYWSQGTLTLRRLAQESREWAIVGIQSYKIKVGGLPYTARYSRET